MPKNIVVHKICEQHCNSEDMDRNLAANELLEQQDHKMIQDTWNNIVVRERYGQPNHVPILHRTYFSKPVPLPTSFVEQVDVEIKFPDLMLSCELHSRMS